MNFNNYFFECFAIDFLSIYANIVKIAMQITDKTTPRAINSLFIFSKTPKATKSRIAPKVINLPSFPSDLILVIPVKKLKSVKKITNKNTPKTQANRPTKKPMTISFLFISAKFYLSAVIYGIAFIKWCLLSQTSFSGDFIPIPSI